MVSSYMLVNKQFNVIVGQLHVCKECIYVMFPKIDLKLLRM